jgi:putative N6-adenine-specific DNA methylase
MDPMCGSGTLVVEAAMIAASIPPGIFRKWYGFETWRDFDLELMEHVARQLPQAREIEVPMVARDIDPGALELTRNHLKSLDLNRFVQLEQGDFALARGGGEGTTLVMNPPYGERLKHEDLLNLYAMIGSTLKHSFPGSDAWILSSSREAMGRIGLKPSSKRILYNGSIQCSYIHYQTFQGKYKAFKTSKGGT